MSREDVGVSASRRSAVGCGNAASKRNGSSLVHPFCADSPTTLLRFFAAKVRQVRYRAASIGVHFIARRDAISCEARQGIQLGSREHDARSRTYDAEH